MLDVHPPHHAASTWRDFFIHIATIVIGLLIAIGLEQTVERVHEHYQLRETREALSHEFETNRAHLAKNEDDWLLTTVELKNNLLVLEFIREHPHTPQTALPGDLRWVQSPFLYDRVVWDAAERNGITRLMPTEEANHNQAFYTLMNTMAQQSMDDWNAINDARHFDLVDTDPTHLSPQQLDKVIELTETALEKHIELGYSFGRAAHEFPDMPHAITWENISLVRPTAFALDPKGLAGAHAITEDRLNAAGAILSMH